MTEFTILSQQPVNALNKAGQIEQKTEVRFEWADSFVGMVRVNPDNVTPERLKEAIEDYIRRHSLE